MSPNYIKYNKSWWEIAIDRLIPHWFPCHLFVASFISFSFLSDKAHDVGGICTSFLSCVTPGMNWRCLSATPGSVAKGRPQMPSQRAASPSVSSLQEKGLCHRHFSFSPHIRAKANNNLSTLLYNQKNLWLSIQPERKPFVAAWKELSAFTWHCFSAGGDGCAPSHLHFSISSHDQG